MYLHLLTLIFAILFTTSSVVLGQFNDICGQSNGKKFYVEHGESGSLLANYENNVWRSRQDKDIMNNKCTVEIITCPSCIVDIKFSYLNISRNCGKALLFDSCGCDYVWIYEPPVEYESGEQFCGRYIQNNASDLNYVSQSRNVAIDFIYNNVYGHAFALDYCAKRNTVHLKGYPKYGNTNNVTQFISSPFFPNLYPADLSREYVINCESIEPCQISLLFTDFLIADSSIIEFFDWNGQRIYVTSGTIFRPPIIMSTGPTLFIRFYANRASGTGFKASYSFILGNLNNLIIQPNIGCGGYVNNLGGGITMMNMVKEGTKFFDCVWIIKPPENLLHRKTHLYVKVLNFSQFAGTTELIIRQGITSNQPSVEVLRHPMNHFSLSKQVEHVVPITQGFYISLRGHFRSDSQLAIVFAGFNYKDCFAGSDFLCHNLRCISILLNCDGFDHCGDNSDESSDCSQDPKDHRQFSKVPNFLFPKMTPYSDIAAASLVFFTCCFGLIGIILASALLIYRINNRARNHRRMQVHMETIHDILEEGVGDVEEEIIIPDEPPDYEPPPDYDDTLKLKYIKSIKSNQRCSYCNISTVKSLQEIRTPVESSTITNEEYVHSLASTSRSGQTASVKIPASPPPSYENVENHIAEENRLATNEISSYARNMYYPAPGPSLSLDAIEPENDVDNASKSPKEKTARYFENLPKYRSQIFSEIRKSFRYCKSVNFIKHARKIISFSEENLSLCLSDSELLFQPNISKNYWPISKLKRSFSTDDITFL